MNMKNALKLHNNFYNNFLTLNLKANLYIRIELPNKTPKKLPLNNNLEFNPFALNINNSFQNNNSQNNKDNSDEDSDDDSDDDIPLAFTHKNYLQAGIKNEKVLKRVKIDESVLLSIIKTIKAQLNKPGLTLEDKLIFLKDLTNANKRHKHMVDKMDIYYLKEKTKVKEILADPIAYPLTAEENQEGIAYLKSINVLLNYTLNENKRINKEQTKIFSDLKIITNDEVKLVPEEKNFTGTLYNKKKKKREYADNYEAERDFKLNIHKKNIYATPYFQEKKRRNKFNFNKSKKVEPEWKKKKLKKSN